MTVLDRRHSGEEDRPASRKVNINASPETILRRCAKHDLAVSSIEKLASGGTQVVMTTLDDATRLRELCGRQVITERVVRLRFSQT